MDNNRIQLFSSFFSAIQSFVREIVTSGSKGLQNISMGNFSIKVTSLPKIDVEIVAITDKDDEKALNKSLPRIIKCLEDFKELFKDWDGNIHRFDILDVEIIKILQDNHQLLGEKSLADGQKEIMESLMQRMPDMEKEQKESLEKERANLYSRLKTTESLPKKLEILDTVENMCRKLKDSEGLTTAQKERTRFANEMNDTKNRLKIFIFKTKEAISKSMTTQSGRDYLDMDFKDAYLNLYSFSSKLRLLGRTDLSDQFRGIAQLLIDKPIDKKEEISKSLTLILRLPDDPNELLNRTSFP